MTEDEAKTTRCCGPVGCGRSEYAGRQGGDIDGNVIWERWCIGSACMAFREGGYPPMVGDTITIKIPPDPKIVHGFCGLAGKP